LPCVFGLYIINTNDILQDIDKNTGIGKVKEEPNCSLTEECIKKMWCISTMKYCPAIKKNEIMPSVATWMDLESFILSEVS